MPTNYIGNEITVFGQRDPRWANDRHGTSNSTLGKTGCTISVLASMLRHAGFDTDPQKLNNLMTANGGYAQGNLVIWTAIGRFFSGVRFVQRLYSYDNAKAIELLEKGLMVVCEVSGAAIGAPGGKHWVGLIGDGKAIDPWDGVITPAAKWQFTGMAVYEYTPKSTQPGNDMMEISKADFARIRSNSEKWDKTHDYLELEGDPATTPFDTAKNTLAGWRSRLTDLANRLTKAETEASNRTEQVSRLKAQVLDEVELRKALETKLKQATKSVSDITGVYEGRIEKLQTQVDTISAEKGKLEEEKAQLVADVDTWKGKYNQAVKGNTQHLTFFELIKLLFNRG